MVGRKVLQAATTHMTHVTLELGGNKGPAVILPETNLHRLMSLSMHGVLCIVVSVTASNRLTIAHTLAKCQPKLYQHRTLSGAQLTARPGFSQTALKGSVLGFAFGVT